MKRINNGAVKHTAQAYLFNNSDNSKPSGACGSACGAGDGGSSKPSACGSSCGTGEK